MKSIYIVMSYYSSPIYITEPHPVAAFATSKEAKAYCAAKNAKAVRNRYGYTRVSFGVTK